MDPYDNLKLVVPRTPHSLDGVLVPSEVGISLGIEDVWRMVGWRRITCM